MSTLKTILRSSTLICTGAAALLMTACASNSSSARYGNVYDYESGGNCDSSACMSAPVQTARYSEPQQVVYADCSVVQGMDCGVPMAQTYPTYQEHVQSYPVYDAAPAISYGGATSYGEAAPCPAGTTAAADGTCLQSSYGSTSYNTGSTSYGSTSYGESASCPAGPSMQGDGTCAMNEGSAISSGTTYGGYTNSGSYTTQDYMPIRK